MPQPEISVIMLTYNREALVGRAIESILNQTLKEIEFIIVDNGATDSSGAIADSYAAADRRIHVIHREAGNIGSGRNAGLDLASGKYIAFIDDDDYTEPDFLSFLHGMAITYDADIAVCGSNKEENGAVSPNYLYVYDELYVMDAYQATEAYLRRMLYNAAMPTKLVRRNMFDRIRFSNTGSYDDISTTYRYFSNAKTVVAHGIPKYTFYRHPGNNSSAATKHYLLNPVQLGEYLAAFRDRTAYVSNLLPGLYNLAQYSEWSYMISMVQKIHYYKLTNCDEPLGMMKHELQLHRDDFLKSPWTQAFEKNWMEQYVLLGEKA
jgi:glycosyltransferase involved in cell wall biosynthesis